MMTIELICVGKIKEEYFTLAVKEYSKRIKPYAILKINEIKEVTSNEVVKNLYEEGKDILKSIDDSDFVVTLEIEGKMLDSVELADFVSHHFTYENRKLVFVIGSSNGLSLDVKKRSNYKLSFSKMTFPHQLMRVIFMEQLYRALSIINNIKYHK